MFGNLHTHTTNPIIWSAYKEQCIGIEFPNALEDKLWLQRRIQRSVFSVLQQYFENKGWGCNVLVVLFPLSLSSNTEQMECKIFQLVAATIKVTKHFERNPMIFTMTVL